MPTYLVNAAYYWSGTQWRQTPILHSVAWTRAYFVQFGRVVRFGSRPVDMPTAEERREFER